MGEIARLKPDAREDLKARLAAMNEADEAAFRAEFGRFHALCIVTRDNPELPPAVRNAARIAAVCLAREGKALAAIRGSQ